MKEQSAYITKLIDNSIAYLKYFAIELISYVNYLNALVIGITVNLFTGHSLPGKIAPYIIPVIVQSISKSAVKYKNRHMARLVQLPSEREDPVFIMDGSGNIILSTGLTQKNFFEYNITKVAQIIGKEGFKYLSEFFHNDIKGNAQAQKIEVYSDLFKKWYEVKMKSNISKSGKTIKEYLVWFTDITKTKDQGKRMSNMLQFSDDIISSLPLILEKYIIDEIYKSVAEPLLLHGFGNVFIAKRDEENKLTGLSINRTMNSISTSYLIAISEILPQLTDPDTDQCFISASVADYSSPDDFEKEFPFNEKLQSVIGGKINNFICYKSKNIYMIAFNKKDKSDADELLIKSSAANIILFEYLKDFISTYFINYLKALNDEHLFF